MEIKNAALEGMNLKLEITDFSSRQEAARFVNGFKEGSYEINARKKKRSLDANAYCWVLIDHIAAAIGVPKTTVYRQALKEVGGISDLICIKEEAYPRLKKGWESKGLGWQCIQSPSKFRGCVNATLIYGSSVFDTAQMSRFIDSLVQDAQALGIDTLSDRERSLLLEAWE